MNKRLTSICLPVFFLIRNSYAPRTRSRSMKHRPNLSQEALPASALPTLEWKRAMRISHDLVTTIDQTQNYIVVRTMKSYHVDFPQASWTFANQRLRAAPYPCIWLKRKTVVRRMDSDWICSHRYDMQFRFSDSQNRTVLVFPPACCPSSRGCVCTFYGLNFSRFICLTAKSCSKAIEVNNMNYTTHTIALFCVLLYSAHWCVNRSFLFPVKETNRCVRATWRERYCPCWRDKPFVNRMQANVCLSFTTAISLVLVGVLLDQDKQAIR